MFIFTMSRIHDAVVFSFLKGLPLWVLIFQLVLRIPIGKQKSMSGKIGIIYVIGRSAFCVFSFSLAVYAELSCNASMRASLPLCIDWRQRRRRRRQRRSRPAAAMGGDPRRSCIDLSIQCSGGVVVYMEHGIAEDTPPKVVHAFASFSSPTFDYLAAQVFHYSFLKISTHDQTEMDSLSPNA